MNDYHVPVLLKEVLEYLKIEDGKRFIDCNLGGAGHTREIIAKGGVVLGIDQDEDAIDYVEKNEQLAVSNKRLVTRRGNFANLKEIAAEAGFVGVNGILFDLGVSSHQLETDDRGFSFNRNAPLDMRMDRSSGVTAADIVNAGGETELANLFWKYGEERASRKIAKAIIDYRRTKKIETTDELAQIILGSRGRSDGDRMHPATRVFQALRIAVNSELESLESALPQAVELLKPGGRLLVITFHSLEDRIVKNFCKDNADLLRIITDKPVMASDEEVEENPRARSGKLRVVEKI